MIEIYIKLIKPYTIGNVLVEYASYAITTDIAGYIMQLNDGMEKYSGELFDIEFGNRMHRVVGHIIEILNNNICKVMVIEKRRNNM